MSHNASGVADLQTPSRAVDAPRRSAGVADRRGLPRPRGTRRISAALLDRRAGTLNPWPIRADWPLPSLQRGGHCTSARRCSPWSGRARCGGAAPAGAVLAEQVVIASNAYTEGEWTNLEAALLSRLLLPGGFGAAARAPRPGASCLTARVPGTPGRCSAASVAMPRAACCWKPRQWREQARLVPAAMGRSNPEPLLSRPGPGQLGVQLDGLHRLHPRSSDAPVRACARLAGGDRLQRTRRDHRYDSGQGVRRLPAERRASDITRCRSVT